MDEENSILIKKSINKSFDSKITSDAFPSGAPELHNYAEIHEILKLSYKSNFTPNLEMIYFEELNESHLQEILILHREWFPVKYTRDYIMQFLDKEENEKFAIGCFINLNNIPYLIGSILCNMYHENKFHKFAPDTFTCRNCISRLFFPYKFGYISTLGVINEFRRLGVAKLLIDKALEKMKLIKNCTGVFLHVIEYNQSAIKFYNNIGFYLAEKYKDYYCINDARFDANIFLKPIRNENLFKFSKYKNNKNILETILPI
jgi:ribosomal protein S18 acetylase RimI-like enzyme